MNNIKKLRMENNLTQKEFAKMLNVHQTAVSQWETDKTIPDVRIIKTMTELFGVSADYILGKNPSTQTTPLNERLEVEKIKITYVDGSEKEVTRGVCFSVYDEGENMFVSCDGVAGNNMDCTAVLAIIARIARKRGIDEELYERAEDLSEAVNVPQS